MWNPGKNPRIRIRKISSGEPLEDNHYAKNCGDWACRGDSGMLSGAGNSLMKGGVAYKDLDLQIGRPSGIE